MLFSHYLNIVIIKPCLQSTHPIQTGLTTGKLHAICMPDN